MSWSKLILNILSITIFTILYSGANAQQANNITVPLVNVPANPNQTNTNPQIGGNNILTDTQLEKLEQKEKQYDKTTLLDQARKQCRSVVATGGISAVFDDEGQKAIAPKRYGGSSGGSGMVPVFDAGVISSLGTANSLLGDIYSVLAERNFAEDCFKALALANSINAVKKDLTKNQQKFVDGKLNSPEKVKQDIKNKTLKQEIDKIKKSNNPQKESGIKILTKIINPEEKKGFLYTKEDIDKAARGDFKKAGFWSFWNEVGRGNNAEDYSVETAFAVLNRVSDSNQVVDEDARGSGGLSAARYCTETISGADPDEIKWSDDDCLEFEKEPVIVTSEKIKQIVNAPYNQALSPAGALGLDGGLSNINTRINNGKLFERNLNNNFGNGKDVVSGLADALKIKEALIGSATGTVTLGIEIQKAVNAIYSSSTSSCRFLPVVDRSTVIVEAAVKKVELENYKKDLEIKWTAIVQNPSADYTNFFIKIGLDLSQKYSKDWLLKLVQEARDKIAKCNAARPI